MVKGYVAFKKNQHFFFWWESHMTLSSFLTKQTYVINWCWELENVVMDK